jgi:hypothetical protein
MDDSKPARGSGATPPSARDRRLAKALRENLRRRKAPPVAGEPPQTPPPDDPASGESD